MRTPQFFCVRKYAKYALICEKNVIFYLFAGAWIFTLMWKWNSAFTRRVSAHVREIKCVSENSCFNFRIR